MWRASRERLDFRTSPWWRSWSRGTLGTSSKLRAGCSGALERWVFRSWESTQIVRSPSYPSLSNVGAWATPSTRRWRVVMMGLPTDGWRQRLDRSRGDWGCCWPLQAWHFRIGQELHDGLGKRDFGTSWRHRKEDKADPGCPAPEKNQFQAPAEAKGKRDRNGFCLAVPRALALALASRKSAATHEDSTSTASTGFLIKFWTFSWRSSPKTCPHQYSKLNTMIKSTCTCIPIQAHDLKCTHLLHRKVINDGALIPTWNHSINLSNTALCITTCSA